jgi:hypothetical protein
MPGTPRLRISASSKLSIRPYEGDEVDEDELEVMGFLLVSIVVQPKLFGLLLGARPKSVVREVIHLVREPPLVRRGSTTANRIGDSRVVVWEFR